MRSYKITIVKHNYFEFTTMAGIKYACFFLSYAEYWKAYKEIADNTYSYNIEVIESKKKSVIVD